MHGATDSITRVIDVASRFAACYVIWILKPSVSARNKCRYGPAYYTRLTHLVVQLSLLKVDCYSLRFFKSTILEGKQCQRGRSGHRRFLFAGFYTVRLFDCARKRGRRHQADGLGRNGRDQRVTTRRQNGRRLDVASRRTQGSSSCCNRHVGFESGCG